MSKRTDETTLAVGELVRAGAIANGHDPSQPIEFHVCGRGRETSAFVSFGDLGDCDRRGCAESGASYNDDGELLCTEHLTEWLMEGKENAR